MDGESTTHPMSLYIWGYFRVDFLYFSLFVIASRVLLAAVFGFFLIAGQSRLSTEAIGLLDYIEIYISVDSHVRLNH